MFDHSRWHYKRKIRDVGSGNVGVNWSAKTWVDNCPPSPSISYVPGKMISNNKIVSNLFFWWWRKWTEVIILNVTPQKKSQKGKIIKFNNNNHIIEIVLRFLIHAKYIKCYTNDLPYVSTILSQVRLLLFHCTALKTIQNKRVLAVIATHFFSTFFVNILFC